MVTPKVITSGVTERTKYTMIHFIRKVVLAIILTQWLNEFFSLINSFSFWKNFLTIWNYVKYLCTCKTNLENSYGQSCFYLDGNSYNSSTKRQKLLLDHRLLFFLKVIKREIEVSNPVVWRKRHKNDSYYIQKDQISCKPECTMWSGYYTKSFSKELPNG